MADKHPYVSGTGVLVQVLDQLQKSFPNTINADLLKKLGLAPKNESYIINVVRFLKLIDDQGSRTDSALKVFTLHDPTSFQKEFSQIIRDAYSDLFDLYKDGAWALGDDKLVPFFRQTDQSSELVGKRQASTFKALATYAGHGEPVVPAKARPAKRAEKSVFFKPAGKVTAKDSKESRVGSRSENADTGQKNVGLTVRIEVNLPATGDQETYDKIFKSIRENLLNG